MRRHVRQMQSSWTQQISVTVACQLQYVSGRYKVKCGSVYGSTGYRWERKWLAWTGGGEGGITVHTHTQTRAHEGQDFTQRSPYLPFVPFEPFPSTLFIVSLIRLHPVAETKEGGEAGERGHVETFLPSQPHYHQNNEKRGAFWPQYGPGDRRPSRIITIATALAAN